MKKLPEHVGEWTVWHETKPYICDACEKNPCERCKKMAAVIKGGGMWGQRWEYSGGYSYNGGWVRCYRLAEERQVTKEDLNA